MLKSSEVFGNDDLRRYIFKYIPLKCGCCRCIMKRKIIPHTSSRYHYRDHTWRVTENEFCRGYCNWCCIYNFNHEK